ncbi:MAG: acyl-CoA dehydrogenase family protein [Burkholderiales bacterium]|nr:acyl-CoA dehydrogenase family protein [Burkholderiales bacterium]
MYDLNLTAEQLEFRDTVRGFVEGEVKPAAVHPDRLQPFDKPLLKDALDKASQMGLRTLMLSEDAGGAGADTLTACIVMEEVAAGDVDVAAVLARTATLGQIVFDRLMTPAQRGAWLAKFTGDDGFHLAAAARDPAAAIGWSYHRPFAEEAGNEPATLRKGGDWIVNGSVAMVANAPVAKLFAVQVRTDPKKTGSNGLTTLLVPRDAPGFTVHERIGPFGTTAGGEAVTRWHHGTAAPISFKDCRIPADAVLGREGGGALAAGADGARAETVMAAVNLGIGRAAYEAAVDYGKIRRQGARNIIEHQAIGTKLADCAIRLELARNMIWKAAWSLDHPEAVSGRSVPDLPLHVMARVFTAEAVNDVALLSAECFGAMGVMRDMPLQKYVHDAMVCLHSEETDGAAKLAVAEAIAGYQRPRAA